MKLPRTLKWPPTPRRRPRHLEDNEQMLLISVLRNVWYGDRNIGSTIYHIPNGGKRNAREGARFKQLGVRKGVADLFLPIPIAPFHGAYIEMKSNDGRETEDQKTFGVEVVLDNYYYAVHRSWQGAAIDIIKYLNAGDRVVRAPVLSACIPTFTAKLAER